MLFLKYITENNHFVKENWRKVIKKTHAIVIWTKIPNWYVKEKPILSQLGGIPVFQFSIWSKYTFKSLLYIRFHKKLTELSTITFILLKIWIFILQSSNTQVMAKFSVDLKNALKFTQYFKFLFDQSTHSVPFYI